MVLKKMSRIALKSIKIVECNVNALMIDMACDTIAGNIVIAEMRQPAPLCTVCSAHEETRLIEVVQSHAIIERVHNL